MAIISLKNEINKFVASAFPEILPTKFVKLRGFTSKKLNSKKGSLWIILTTLLVFGCSQLRAPEFVQIIDLPQDTAKIIVDQRVTNLAAIFSITLVVMGWLLTNISVKEALSYEMLFKKTALYPTFFFIITLMGCLILGSLLRHATFFDLQNFMIAATYLIIVALFLIVRLFVKLIEVVDSKFLYNALEIEVLPEVYKKAKREIFNRKGSDIYKSTCEKMGFGDGIGFTTDLSNLRGINILPFDGNDEYELDNKPLAGRLSKVIRDIKLSKLEKTFKSIGVISVSYYRPLNVNSIINENFHPFYLAGEQELTEKNISHVRKSYKLANPVSEPKIPTTNYQEHLNSRFLKDVNDGNKENIQRALRIYEKIYDLENKIIKEC